MDLSSLARPAQPVALLIDGENISRAHIAALGRAAGEHGQPQVRRVYGAAEHITAWDDHGYRLCPTRPGKNAADLLLCVDAMDLALREGFGTILIASSDRDFTYLAERLRELGKRVIGLGEAKAPRAFQAACSDFVMLQLPAAPPIQPTKAQPIRSVEGRVSGVISGGGLAGFPIAALGPAMQKLDFRVGTTPERTWRKWLTARSNLFACDPKGPQARVRLRQPALVP